MKLIEFARSIKRPLFVEIRPGGEYVIGFGLDCSLKSPSGCDDAIHGRGPCITCAIEDMVRKLNQTTKPALLKFPPDYDRITAHTVPDVLEFEGDGETVIVNKAELKRVLAVADMGAERNHWESSGRPQNHVYPALKHMEEACR